MFQAECESTLLSFDVFVGLNVFATRVEYDCSMPRAGAESKSSLDHVPKLGKTVVSVRSSLYLLKSTHTTRLLTNPGFETK